MLEALSHLWAKLARRLARAGAAHADLQHGNILLVPGRSENHLAIKLIDYDGMFVPALAGKPSGEVGHPAYQHPQRLQPPSPARLTQTPAKCCSARKPLVSPSTAT